MRNETRLGNSGLILSGPSGSDLVYENIQALPRFCNALHAVIVASGSDQSSELSMPNGDDGEYNSESPQNIL